MAISPVSLPQAAGIEYGNADVRHFSPGDTQDVPSLQNPTRQLAERDNKLAEKVNEVIQTVNNQEQFVPLPVMRTILPPMDETIVFNYRIPVGFESRVLNAVIASSPVSTDIELNIYYNTTFGGVAGTSVVTTAAEYSGGISFYQAGEFVIGLKNKTGQTLELVASVLLTLRPIGAEGSLLVASTVKGDKGDPGQTGPRGTPGTPGTGGAGSPGMNWRGPWNSSDSYLGKDVVSFDLYGSLTSSFIAIQSNTNQSPQNSYTGGAGIWEPVALGHAGVAGPDGPAGGAPAYSSNVVNGTFVTHGDYIAVSYNGSYNGFSAAQPGVLYTYPMAEVAVVDQSGTEGLAVLSAATRLAFQGHVDVCLPNRSNNGALCDYSTTNIQCGVALNGTNNVDGATIPGVLVAATGTSYQIYSTGSNAMTINFFGAQVILP